jgi:hypothetical protein
MALPKIGIPSFELQLPSTGKSIKYRPFLVKEEKVLLIALESEDENHITTAVRDLIKSCILTPRIKVEDLPTFDLEYIFLRIRAAAVGEIVQMKVVCKDDDVTRVDVNININDVEVVKNPDHNSKIMLTDDTGIIMKYPSMDRFIEAEFLNKDIKTEEVFDFIAEHVEQIFTADEVFDASTTSKKEMKEWIEGLTTKQFEAIQKFYETMPKLSHTFTVVNPNTGKESEYTIEGLQNFFG